MAETLEEVLEPFISVETLITAPMITLVLMFFTYGLYVLIFGACIRILYHRKSSPNRGFYLGGSTVLFVLATITTGFWTLTYIRQSVLGYSAVKTQDYVPFLLYVQGDKLKTATYVVVSVTSILINITADAMLIHRCYKIWGCQKWVALPLIFVVLVQNAVGLASAIMIAISYTDRTIASNYELLLKGNAINDGYYVASGAVNGLITLMTAGRIWWITRQARRLLGRGVQEKYVSIVVIILESGMIYPVLLIIGLIITHTTDPTKQGLVPVDFFPLVSLAAGIAPTIIIVRAGLGKAVESVNQVVPSVHFIGMDEQRGTQKSGISEIRFAQRSLPSAGESDTLLLESLDTGRSHT
ncbi:hypothetical protein WG66_016153 [Moniliophthora roreri]|uniref:Integral membrane protein n=1 Tax=Moniliophthora roreri TaxID=221103 RepID=A0A0W0EY05_MONRR|nr:hypothetical protein WG66_016153 [Moniliophthora roreri]